jgi:hypothetical protein
MWQQSTRTVKSVNGTQPTTKLNADLKYPMDFAGELVKQWSRLQPPQGPAQSASTSKPGERRIVLCAVESACPDLKILEELVGILYHVSFLTEESRKLAVRISYLTPGDFKSKSPDERFIHNQPVVFSLPRPFTTTEVTCS